MLALLDYFGSPEAVWEAEKPALLGVPRIGEKIVERIVEGRKRAEETQNQMAGWEEQDVDIITILDSEYPEKLHKLGDPPSLLFVRGKFDLSDGPTIAVVGTHEADMEGVLAAENWSQRIARRGAVVVSGLARGIDAAAHVGAIQAGGKTIGVLGCGFAKMYPPENGALAEQIIENGAVVSEYSPPTPVAVGRLMARNRIVVGLADAVLIVQVHESSSGTMDAAIQAEKQGKPVYVVSRPEIPQLGQLKSCGAIVMEETDGVDMVLNYL
jgi:DNA processing protein